MVLSLDGAWSGFDTSFLVLSERRLAVAMTCNSPDVGVDVDVAERIVDLWTG